MTTTVVPQGRAKYSFFDEQRLIAQWLARLAPGERYFVDIGAGDGRFSSNTLALVEDGWPGLAIECDPVKFAKLHRLYASYPHVSECRQKVTPDNVVTLLREHRVPREPGFLSLDIDSHDYFVLDRLLRAYRPALMCVEINEKLPPPVKFAVKYAPDHVWQEDHFYGMSLSKLDELRARHGLALVELEYSNALLVPGELCPEPSRPAGELYRSGYLDRPDRKAKFPWNADMEFLLELPPEQQVRAIQAKFQRYAGQFVCGL